jgi:RNA recognition motif-containing protein
MSAQEENGEETEYQQVDYDESGLQHQHEETNEFQLAEQQRTSNQTAKDGNNQKQRTLPPDENGDIIVPNVLFVSRFRFGSTTEPEIKRHFEKYGSIKSVSLRHKVAYVEYENDDDAKQAKQDAHYKPGLGSDSLIVDFKKENKVKVSFSLRFFWRRLIVWIAQTR